MSEHFAGRNARQPAAASRRSSNSTWRADCIAALLSAVLVLLIGLLIAVRAEADSANSGFAADSPIAVEAQRPLFFDGDSARLLVQSGAIRPFVSAGAGSRLWGPDPLGLEVSSRSRDDLLTGVAGGVNLRIAPPLGLSLTGGWVHDLSQPYEATAENGFGTAGATLELRF